MNTRTTLVLLVSLLAGLGAALLANGWLIQQVDRPERHVVVCSMDLEPGTRLEPQMLKTVAWPAASMPEGAFFEEAPPTDRVLRTGLSRGEPVLESKLAPQGTRGGLSAVIGEGRRAITVRVNDVVGVAGFALPGNYVDIVVNVPERQAGVSPSGSVSKIVLEQILVLAVAQEASRDDTRPKVVNAVTLEVTPEQAETLDLARSVGNLSLVLRNQMDRHPSSTRGATRETLLSLPAALPVGQPSAVQPRQALAAARSHRASPAPVPVVSSASPLAFRDPNACVEVIRATLKSVECF